MRTSNLPLTMLLASVLLSGTSRSAAAAEPLRVCLVSGSEEYESDRTLAEFGRRLEELHGARTTLVSAEGTTRLPGLEALEACDVALFFTRRLTLPAEELEKVKRYCLSGKPLVAVRTGSHGFQNWLEFDRLVLGGSYGGHCGPGMNTGRPTLEAKPVPAAVGHPILQGVGTLRSRASLYKTAPLSPDAQVLLVGTSLRCPEPQPAAWTRLHDGGRVVYVSLGAQGDFENSSFRRLLVNALFWAAGREAEQPRLAPVPPLPPRRDGDLALSLRTRTEVWKGSGIWEEGTFLKKVPAARAAILICDMWDEHWCRGATERCGKLAETMGPVVEAARARGVRIIHAPSETMGFYADWPGRRRMVAVPRANMPKALELSDPPLPIDDSDGGCDTEEKPWYPAWTRQHPAIPVGPEDGISDSGEEIYSFLAQEGIEHLLVMGVHTNMCVLGRSFGIRQMTRLGIRCILVRDLTDTMYDPKDRPQVSHEAGTELVVQHIEKYWCPSILSADLLKAVR